MKTIEKYTIIKNTEKATLFRCFISEVNEETEFWMQKSKYEEKEKMKHDEFSTHISSILNKIKL